ncbi:MAG: universal stress protein [Planctomycetes bacterium]|nr:universal stress protein [Planctomycetota bacterium]
MKVFFAVDGSPGSMTAVRQVGQLLSADRDVPALYFAPPEMIVRHAASGEDMHARARQALTDVVFQEARSQLPPPLQHKAVPLVAEHTAAEGIRLEAEKWGAELIVLGARGLTTFESMFLGSVSSAVAQTSTVPVLVVRPDAPSAAGRPYRVLYAFDGSAGSTAALSTAEQFTLPAGSEVIAVTVIEALTAGDVPEWLMKKARDADTEAMSQHWVREHESEKRQACDQLTEFMGKRSGPFQKAEVICAEGHAAEQILKIAAQRQVDLIVLGSHGKGMLHRLLIGSTSSKVLNQAHCSVLIARGN